MRLGFMNVKDMRALPFEEVAKWGAENGFAAVDARLEGIDVCHEIGIEVGATHITGDLQSLEGDDLKQAQEEKTGMIDEAVSKGVTRGMILHRRLPGISTEESIERFAQGWGPIAEYAEERGFRLVMEIYHGHGSWLAVTPELIRAVFDAVPSKGLGICLDPSHFVVQGIDYLKATREFGDRIYYAHAKDAEILDEELYDYGIFGQALGTDRPFAGWWRYRLPGYGQIDWRRFLATLVEVGYDDVLAVEHEDPIWYGNVELNKKGLLLSKRYLEPMVI